MKISARPQYSQGGKWLLRSTAKYHHLTVLSDDGKDLQQPSYHGKYLKKKNQRYYLSIKTLFIRHEYGEEPVSFCDSPDEIHLGFMRDLTSRVHSSDITEV